MSNPLLDIQKKGQSIWLDFLRRGMIISGELKQLIDEDGLRGITSNPAIFDKVIDGSKDYLAAIETLALEGKSAAEIYQILTVEDVQQAADLFQGVYKNTEWLDGYISLEVNPHLAHDTAKTIDEARHLWNALGRPNVLIKVPATLEGLPAIEQLISEAINVNVTLLFGLDRYRVVADAFISGIEKRVKAGKSVEQIASVASFFLSRIDVMTDPLLEKIMAENKNKAAMAKEIRGESAIASAKLAYQIYKEIYSTERWKNLDLYGARPQRLLWASTSTKNPEYSDVKYVEPLIGPSTVNTMPMETINAFRDHGKVGNTLENDVEKARDVIDKLMEVGIDISEITQNLENEGVEKFNKPYDKLMKSLENKRKQASKEKTDRQYLRLGKFQKVVDNRMAEMEKAKFGERFWRLDASLWKADEKSQNQINNSLGWLHSPEKMADHISRLEEFAATIINAGFKHVVHMGMGGSSLAPLVFERSFKKAGSGLPLTILDTTDPGTIIKIENKLPLKDTLFIVASKSGTTSEPLAFGDYFYDKIKRLKGDKAGENFIAITDPESYLVKLANERKFRAVFLNFTDIGGRYSALSYFGLVPAALMGIPVEMILERAERMIHACSSCVKVADNPGFSLGAAIGELAKNGHDKLTFVVSKSLTTLGLWLEQLIAESTGKEGTGILPIAGEPVGDPSVYGDDRVFAYLSLKEDNDTATKIKIDKLIKAGQPVITIQLEDINDIAQEFLRWEIATAVAGAILGINAFDQPNVQESKDNTKRLLMQVEKNGGLHEEEPAFTTDSMKFYAGQKSDDEIALLRNFLKQAAPNCYVSLQAYLTEEPETDKLLQEMRTFLRDKLHLASTLGYGPRFLHSTGQYHKGGPNDGLFLQLTADDSADAPIPGKPYSFGTLKKAQALGDLEALRKHNRRIISVHMGKDVPKALENLKKAFAEALSDK